MEWNYYNTFITLAPDCPAEEGTVPPDKKDGKTKAGIEYELVSAHPYGYSQEELMFEVHVRHKGISPEELEAKGTQIRDEFFQKSHACMRASMLPKKFGWGLHFNEAGKVALVPADSEQYRSFVEGRQGELKLLAAMRNSR
ncbi:DUF6157 family protein [Paenibacillus hodogayensis]|uniref:DUF6157 family protein n=1 Tax=Paenibacillus hodogayensis TaxID=279208 RepID=A0ABV5W172_9BACL